MQRTSCPVATQPLGIAPKVKAPGTVSTTVVAAVVAAVPSLNTVSTYRPSTPTVKLGGDASLPSRSCGASAAVAMLAEHRAASCGHPGSPPPLTVAVSTNVPLAVGVTGMMKLTPWPGVSPGGTVHVTRLSAAAQPSGSVPSAKESGTSSATVLTAVVAAVPSFTTVSV